MHVGAFWICVCSCVHRCILLDRTALREMIPTSYFRPRLEQYHPDDVETVRGGVYVSEASCLTAYAGMTVRAKGMTGLVDLHVCMDVYGWVGCWCSAFSIWGSACLAVALMITSHILVSFVLLGFISMSFASGV